MKRELLAILCLAVIFTGCLVNIRSLDNLTDELLRLVDEAERQAEVADWDSAVKTVEDAMDLWKKSGGYAAIALSSADIDTITQCLHDLHSDAADHQEHCLTDTAELAKARLEALRQQEHISWGSVF